MGNGLWLKHTGQYKYVDRKWVNGKWQYVYAEDRKELHEKMKDQPTTNQNTQTSNQLSQPPQQPSKPIKITKKMKENPKTKDVFKWERRWVNGHWKLIGLKKVGIKEIKPTTKTKPRTQPNPKTQVQPKQTTFTKPEVTKRKVQEKRAKTTKSKTVSGKAIEKSLKKRGVY